MKSIDVCVQTLKLSLLIDIRRFSIMKITDYTLYKVPPRWLFLKIETDEGIVGWGEPVIEGRADTVKAAVQELMTYLIGKNPFHIEDHWNTLYLFGFYRCGPILMSALSGMIGIAH